MKKKIQLFLGLLVFSVCIGAGVYLYNMLSANYSDGTGVLGPSEGGTGQTAPIGESEKPQIQAIDVSMQDKDGNEVMLSDFYGKPVVVNFWASWCPPCKEEMPEFDKVWLEMGDDVAFIMLNMPDGARETVEKGQKYVQEMGFSFPVYFDVSQEAAYTYGITSIPSTIFLDKNGYIAAGVVGAINEGMLREGIEIARKNSAVTDLLP